MGNTSSSTEYKQILYRKIITAANEAFMTKGVRAVKMDDLAKSLSISKRTLYDLQIPINIFIKLWRHI